MVWAVVWYAWFRDFPDGVAKVRPAHSLDFPWRIALRNQSVLALLLTTACYRTLGVASLSAAGLFTIAAMVSTGQMLTVIFLTLVYAAITFQQSGFFGVCLDIGQKYSGGLIGSVLYGYLVERFASYDAPFVPMAAVLFPGALLWCKIDASQELSPALSAAA